MEQQALFSKNAEDRYSRYANELIEEIQQTKAQVAPLEASNMELKATIEKLQESAKVIQHPANETNSIGRTLVDRILVDRINGALKEYNNPLISRSGLNIQRLAHLLKPTRTEHKPVNLAYDSIDISFSTEDLEREEELLFERNRTTFDS